MAETSKIELTAQIVTSYVGKNTVPTGELPALIRSVHASLYEVEQPVTVEPAPVEKLVPAVSVKKSVDDHHITCLEDGQKFKSMRRHLMAHHNMTPEQYRAKWGLPNDYPMVAPAYAAARSILAKSLGLGKKKSAEPAPTKKSRARRILDAAS